MSGFKDLYIVISHTSEIECATCYSLDEARKYINADHRNVWHGYGTIDTEVSEYHPCGLVEIQKVISPFSHAILETYYIFKQSVDMEKLALFC